MKAAQCSKCRSTLTSSGQCPKCDAKTVQRCRHNAFDCDKCDKQSQAQAQKFDSGKVRFSLLPWDAVTEVARVFTFGAEKYDARNWEKGLTYSRIYDATQRHLTSWFQQRQTLDPDGTGLRQLGQAAFGCLALLAFELRGRTDLDDRPEVKNA